MFVHGELTGSKVQLPIEIQSRYSESIKTHDAVTVSASATTTRVEVATKGYSKAIIMQSATGTAQTAVNAVLADGTIITDSNLAITDSKTNDYKLLDLNGAEKVSVYGTDTSVASNAITIEIALIA